MDETGYPELVLGPIPSELGRPDPSQAAGEAFYAMINGDLSREEAQLAFQAALGTLRNNKSSFINSGPITTAQSIILGVWPDFEDLEIEDDPDKILEIFEMQNQRREGFVRRVGFWFGLLRNLQQTTHDRTE